MVVIHCYKTKNYTTTYTQSTTYISYFQENPKLTNRTNTIKNHQTLKTKRNKGN